MLPQSTLDSANERAKAHYKNELRLRDAQGPRGRYRRGDGKGDGKTNTNPNPKGKGKPNPKPPGT